MRNDKLVLVSVFGAAVTNIVLWAILLIKFGYSQEQVPLHYNAVYGIDFVGEARQIYQLPATGLVVLLVNFLLARSVYPSFRFFGYILTFTAFVVQIILLVGGIFVVILNR